MRHITTAVESVFSDSEVDFDLRKRTDHVFFVDLLTASLSQLGDHMPVLLHLGGKTSAP